MRLVLINPIMVKKTLLCWLHKERGLLLGTIIMAKQKITINILLLNGINITLHYNVIERKQVFTGGIGLECITFPSLIAKLLG